MKKYLKRSLALLLACGMIFSESLPTYGAVLVDKGSALAGTEGRELLAEELLNEEPAAEELTDEETIEESPAAEDSAVYEALSEEAAAPSEEEGKFYGRVDEGQEEAQISENAEDEESLSEELPAKYDLRDWGYSTSVKDQDPWGTCWTFGTLASAESNAIKNGIAKSDVDYAERHLAYYVYNNYYEEDGKRKGINDPLGNTEGDYAVYEYESKNPYNAGGSETKALFYILGWRGPADESKFPYSDKADPAISMENIYNNSMAHLQNFGIINVKKQPLQVKKALMEHGVLAISYYDDDDSYGDNGAYYCTNGSISRNHTVALIGWDDNYTFGKNKKGEQPKNKGAWIVKNSWGTTASCLDKGYMYISYEDATFVNAYYQEYEKNDNYDNNYFYSGGTLYKTFDEANTVANIYEIKKGNQVLKACGIGIVDTDVNYELQIYKNPTDPTNPESGEKMLTTPVKGKTTFEGFYTVPLNSPQIFAKGDKVAVVFYLYKGDDIKASEPVKVYVDASDEVNPGEDEVQFYTKEERNQSLYSKKGRNSKGDFEGEWYDLIDKTPFPFTARIHAYTTNTSWAIDYKDIDNLALELSTGESYQIKLAEGSTASFADLEIKSDKDSVATVSADGKISAVGAGEAYITVTDKNDEAKYQFISVNVKTDFKTAKLSFKDGKDSFAYTGKEIEPEVVVTVGDKQLVKDTDYELEYKNNMEAGSLTTTPSRYPCVVVTGKGSYKDAGSKKLAFTIEKKSLTASDVKVEPLYTKIYYS
ncbi:MAG: Ig-like domain-containing protein, partial [Lachnospiraceae bacterium]|nr:Ig-like domain-containing protein [Lachnospiraceae bacterium]